MSASFRPLIYTWGAILGGVAGAAAALQIMGPPHRPAPSAFTALPPTKPLAAAEPKAVPRPSAPEAVAVREQPAALRFDTDSEPKAARSAGVLEPPALGLAGEKPAVPPAAGLPSLATVPVPRPATNSIAAELPPSAPRRISAERHRPFASTAPKPLSPEGVRARKPDFIGVYVTQADGTRVFKALP